MAGEHVEPVGVKLAEVVGEHCAGDGAEDAQDSGEDGERASDESRLAHGREHGALAALRIWNRIVLSKSTQLSYRQRG